METYRITTQLN